MWFPHTRCRAKRGRMRRCGKSPTCRMGSGGACHRPQPGEKGRERVERGVMQGVAGTCTGDEAFTAKRPRVTNSIWNGHCGRACGARTAQNTLFSLISRRKTSAIPRAHRNTNDDIMTHLDFWLRGRGGLLTLHQHGHRPRAQSSAPVHIDRLPNLVRRKTARALAATCRSIIERIVANGQSNGPIPECLLVRGKRK
jgi:hypothetical protein